MMEYKKNIRTVVVLLLFGMFAVWFWGWESIRFDGGDKEIGKKVIFLEPMIYTNEVPDNMAGEMVAEKYGAVIWNKNSWKNFESYFPQIKSEDINCSEIFTVVDVFYIERHGLLTRAFTSDHLKYYVLTSANYKTSVMSGRGYELYSKDISSVIGNAVCVTATD